MFFRTLLYQMSHVVRIRTISTHEIGGCEDKKITGDGVFVTVLVVVVEEAIIAPVLVLFVVFETIVVLLCVALWFLSSTSRVAFFAFLSCILCFCI